MKQLPIAAYRRCKSSQALQTILFILGAIFFSWVLEQSNNYESGSFSERQLLKQFRFPFMSIYMTFLSNRLFNKDFFVSKLSKRSYNALRKTNTFERSMSLLDISTYSTRLICINNFGHPQFCMYLLKSINSLLLLHFL